MKLRHSTTAIAISAVVLMILITATSMFAQIPTPKAVPYMTARLAGGVATNTTFSNGSGAAAWNNQIACPTLYNGQTLYAIDQSGDGCLAVDAYVQQPEAVQFDSAGNAYIANVSSPANASIVQKVDAVTGIISLFAGGLTAVSATGTTPCASPDPVVSAMTGVVSPTAGDGCQAVDPGYGVTNNTSNTYFKGIRDIHIDSTSTWLYISDSSNSHVRKVSLPSTPVPYAGTSVLRPYAHECEPVFGVGGSSWHADGSVSAVSAKNPYDVTTDSYGNIFIGDESGFAVRLVTPTTFTASGSTVTPTLGNVTTVMGCVGVQTYGAGSCQTAPSQTANCVGFFTPSSPSTKISRDLGNGEAYGLAFDASGNLYVSDHACYSVYQIPPNPGVSAVTGQTNVVDGTTKVNTPIGASTTTAGSGGTWEQAYGGVNVQGSKMLGFGTPVPSNGLYFFVQTNGWFWDPTDTNATTTSWAHDIWNSTSPFGCAANETMPYDGCPAPNTYIDNGSGMGHGGVDPYGNLYIADYGAYMVSRASLGTNPGFGPRVVVSAQSPKTQTVLINGSGISDTVDSTSAPFAMAGLLSYPSGGPFTTDCSTYGASTDGSTDCLYSVTYTPTAIGEQTGSISANGASVPLTGYGTGPFNPTLTMSCPATTYDGQPQMTCEGTATGLGGAAVEGTWSFSINGVVGAGVTGTVTGTDTETVTGTFTTTDPNYVSGGTASASFTVGPAQPIYCSATITPTGGTAADLPNGSSVVYGSGSIAVTCTSLTTDKLVWVIGGPDKGKTSGTTTTFANPGATDFAGATLGPITVSVSQLATTKAPIDPAYGPVTMTFTVTPLTLPIAFTTSPIATPPVASPFTSTFGAAVPKFMEVPPTMAYSDKAPKISFTINDANNSPLATAFSKTSPPGYYTVVPSVVANPNYTFTTTTTKGGLIQLANGATVIPTIASGTAELFKDAALGSTSKTTVKLGIANKSGAHLSYKATFTNSNFTVVNPALTPGPGVELDTCDAPTGTACKFVVTFTPDANSTTADTAVADNLVVAVSDLDNVGTFVDPGFASIPKSFTYPVSGNAVGPFTATLTNSPFSPFPSAANGSTSSDSITITNNSDWPLTVASAKSSAAKFFVVGTIPAGCTGLASGSTCSIPITFAPVAGKETTAGATATDQGTYNASVLVAATVTTTGTDGATDKEVAQSVALTANDTTWVSYAPTSTAGLPQFTGKAGKTVTQDILFTNNTDVPSLSSAAAVTAGSTAFTVTNCSAVPGKTCKIAVIATVPATGTVTGTLTITDGFTNPSYSLSVTQ